MDSTAAQPTPNQVNGVLRNAIFECLSSFWIYFEMPFINWLIELTIRWTKHSVLSVLGATNGDNDDVANSNSITFTIRHKIICSYRHFISKRQSKLSKRLREGFERSVY